MAYSEPILFKERLREAYKAKGTTVEKLLLSIGIAPKSS